MPTRDKAPAGAPNWLELSTTDVQRACDFYTTVFDWELDGPHDEMGGYFNFLRQGVPIAGGMAAQPGGNPNTWAVYLASDDARKSAEVAAAHGAQVVVPATDVMDLGVMAVVIDPTPTSTGIWQPGTHLGFNVTGEPGAPGWIELHTPAFKQTLEFYKDTFGWEPQIMSDTDEFRYAVVILDGQQVAGISDDGRSLPSGSPGFWRVYFWTDSTDKTVEKIVAAGGEVRRPAEETPYGRLAEVSDPLGAVFSVMAANDQMPAR